MSLTFAKYVVQPIFPNCDMPENGIRLIAALAICLLTFINCYNVRITTKVQDVFMVTKVSNVILSGNIILSSNIILSFINC